MKDYEFEHSVTTKGNVTKVKAVKGYNADVDVLCKVKNNGNGYTVKFPSYSSVHPPVFMNIDYAQAEYLFLAFKSIYEKE